MSIPVQDNHVTALITYPTSLFQVMAIEGVRKYSWIYLFIYFIGVLRGMCQGFLTAGEQTCISKD